MMTKKRILAAAVAALLLGLATVPASAGRLSALKHAFKQAQNAADLHNFGSNAHRFSQGFEWSGFQRGVDPSENLQNLFELKDLTDSVVEAHEMSETLKRLCGDDEGKIEEGSRCPPLVKPHQQADSSEELELMISPIILSPRAPVQWQEPNQ